MIENKIITQWQPSNLNDLAEFVKNFLAQANIEYQDIYVVGSRLLGGFREDSDLDIRVDVTKKQDKDKLYNLAKDGVKIQIFTKEKNEKVYGRFELSMFSLLTKRLIKGADDEIYKRFKAKTPKLKIQIIKS